MKTIIQSLILSFVMVLALAGCKNGKNKTDDPGGNGIENGYSYVDMGLSVKWATCNIGAKKPEDYGEYYAWGETKTKYSYDRFTSKYGSNKTLTKYCTKSGFGTFDDKKVLESEDDVAYEKWGGNWRMPTNEEFCELMENCTWTWTTKYFVKGYLVTSNKAGYTDRSIFLPAAGYRHGTSLHDARSDGGYWSSSLYDREPADAWYLGFNSHLVDWYTGSRIHGFSVRPVCP